MPVLDDIYLGNPNLKKANVPIDFTQEQLLEYMACREDPVYFAKQHVKIVSLDEGLTAFKPYDFQEKDIERHTPNSTSRGRRSQYFRSIF